MSGVSEPAGAIRYDRPVQLSPTVRRLTQPNPGTFTGAGTNTYLVGTDAVVVLEPGEDRSDGHLDRIVEAVGARPVVAVIPSHGHEDHWTLAPALAERLGAPVAFAGRAAGFRVDWILKEGDRLDVGGLRVDVLHTPGHTPEHLSFLLPAEGALFPGDHVMGWSTSVIAPPEGDLAAYLRSLDRLLALPDLRVAYPAHGESIDDPYARIRELAAHRRERTRQLVAALRQGPGSVETLVRRVYVDTDPSLYPAAALSLGAHLLALEGEGRVVRADVEGAGAAETVWALRG